MAGSGGKSGTGGTTGAGGSPSSGGVPGTGGVGLGGFGSGGIDAASSAGSVGNQAGGSSGAGGDSMDGASQAIDGDASPALQIVQVQVLTGGDGSLLVIVFTGFATELLHFTRIEPLRHAAYAAHLVAVFVLLWMLPYSKLAHVVYRALALLYAERTGRGAR